MQRTNGNLYVLLFLFFCASGCCSLIYQNIWIRLAFASFGIITPVLSVVLSVFMMGLSLGAWLGGKTINSLVNKSKTSAIAFYGAAELLIGISGAFFVPHAFKLAEKLLLQAGESDSAAYLFQSAGLIALSIFPCCFLLGTTFPFALSFVKEQVGNEDSFSHLYLANVFGAVLGVVLSSFVLVELLGFAHTLWFAAGLNFAIAAVSFFLAGTRKTAVSVESDKANTAETVMPKEELKWMYFLLFTTGFCSMAMEVIWTRGFTPSLANMTYSFASLLIVYLIATAVGSWLYRRDLFQNKLPKVSQIAASLIILSLFPIVFNDPLLGLGLMQFLLMLKAQVPSLPGDSFWIWVFLKGAIALASIFPLCLKLGYLTPMIIDKTSSGFPEQAGKDYAINTVGCILGPLVACYFLLPFVGVKGSLVLTTIPFVICYLGFSKEEAKSQRVKTVLLSGTLMVATAIFSMNSEIPVFEKYKLYRDHTATVITCGSGLKKELLVNGRGMTNLVQDTKEMAMLPIMFHQGPVDSALTICFGMGTTFRSLLNWDVATTVVELVPSVKKAFPDIWDDAKAVLENPKGKIVIDDGRRFLMRTHEKYDVITIDVPPPFEASGVSLLFSKEFYALVKLHMNKGAVLQTFIQPSDDATKSAVTRSLVEAFKNVRAFKGKFGYLYLASEEPLIMPDLDVAQKAVSEKAKRDYTEWSPSNDVNAEFKKMASQQLAKEKTMAEMLAGSDCLTIVDDLPPNEYFVLRRYLGFVHPCKSGQAGEK